ncbi:hypothetical protein KY363_00850 [Candidatus Woesearchaeota archaeon]|nr:hypothetical protein [Candidatus Woesearchaeota archaeon]
MVKKASETVCETRHGYEYYLTKIGRFCAWSLIAFILLYMITGYGITKSYIVYRVFGMDRGLALKLHTYLTIPMMAAFILHVLIAVRFAMIRWKVTNKTALNWIFIILGAALLSLTVWAYFA